MLTALNVIKLVLIISLGFLYLIGLGWLVIGPVLHGNLFKRRSEFSFYQEIALMMIGGLVINYGLVLLLHSLTTSLIIGSIFSIFGLVCYLLMVSKSLKQIRITADSFLKGFGILLISGFILGPILIQPIIEWDARSIWFFHAKMIYASGSFGPETGWLHPSVLFSHIDYPLLFPILCAQMMHVMGFWNEYLPKLSLIFLLFPAVILLFSFYRRSFSFLILILLVPLSFSIQLWIGYMDGYIALYLAIALLFLGKFYQDSQKIYLISSIYCLLLLLNIKNEGELAFLVGIIAIIVTLLIKNTKDIFKLLKNNWATLLTLLLLLIPFGLWSFYKRQWGISNDLNIGSNESFNQLIRRINDGSIIYIIKEVYSQLRNGLILLVFLLVATIMLRKRIPGEIGPILIAAFIYCIGIIFVYLVTPWDIVWHLESSVDRTVLLITTCTYAASFFLLDHLETKELKP